ncbi:MAG: hypothetical protein WAU65_03000 [Candidatus Nanoarchaeia archaeon]
MPKKEMMDCCTGHKMKGVGILLIGLLVLSNVYWPFLDWGTFIGIILVLAGIAKLVMPHKYHG